MASFDIAYNLVKRAEGGYQDIPQDRGNYNSLNELVGTNWGISAPVYERWLGRVPSKEDMQGMTQLEAKRIYKSEFWNDIKGDEILSQNVANILFDGRVNHGRMGTVLMQKVLRVDQDGIVGPVTLNAINESNPKQIFDRYKNERRGYYFDIVRRKPDQNIFLNGWLNRLDRFSFSEVSFKDNDLVVYAVLGVALFLILK